MTSPDEQKEHRQFLLGNLPEQQAQALEERIFLEPELSEDLQIEEEELIAEYHAGTLSAGERRLFERKYTSNEANKRLLKYEATFREFLQSKPSVGSAEQRSSVETDRIFSVETNPIEPLTKPTRAGAVVAWLGSLVPSRRILAYATAIVGLLLMVVAFWYLLSNKSGPTHSVERRTIEAVLGALNPPGKIVAVGTGNEVQLKPIQRFDGEIPRVGVDSVTADGLIQFLLSLTEGSSLEYNATFLDEKRNELFTVSNIPVHATANGQQIWIIVPIKYLPRGDYQIELSDARSKTHDASNSYPFRVTVQK